MGGISLPQAVPGQQQLAVPYTPSSAPTNRSGTTAANVAPAGAALFQTPAVVQAFQNFLLHALRQNTGTSGVTAGAPINQHAAQADMTAGPASSTKVANAAMDHFIMTMLAGLNMPGVPSATSTPQSPQAVPQPQAYGGTM